MQKDRGFILISMLLLAMMISLLGFSSLVQSRLSAYLISNLVEQLSQQEKTDKILYQAEQTIAMSGAVKSGYSIKQIGQAPNSWNYLDYGEAVISEIIVNNERAVWWQRQADYSQQPSHFLAKDGKVYHITLHNQPVQLEFSSGKRDRILLFPLNVTQLGLPLLVDSLQQHYADFLFIADNQNRIWQVNLTRAFSDWRLSRIITLSEPALLNVRLWAAAAPQDSIALYIATKTGIQAWQAGNPWALMWSKPRSAVNFFVEGKRLWWLAKTGFNRLTIGAIDRLSGQALPTPLFVEAPSQDQLEFARHSTDDGWRLVPDNRKQIETLYIAGTSVALYPPPYESGEQSLMEK